MKYGFSLFLLSVFFILISSCKQKESSQPCGGTGIFTFNNKTDSAVLVQIVEAHNTFTMKANYIQSVSVKGDQSYNISIEGRNYYKDTLASVRNCENRGITITR